MGYREQIVDLHLRGHSYSEIRKQLGCSKGTISYHCSRLKGHRAKKYTRHIIPEDELEVAISRSYTWADVFRAIGLPERNSSLYKKVQKIAKELGIDVSHMLGQRHLTGKTVIPTNYKYKIEEVLALDGPPQSSDNLRRRLIKAGIKEHRCEVCGGTRWMERPIPLELHHINGNNQDNRLENLNILCPNCHAQTPNYCAKNLKSRRDMHPLQSVVCQ